MTHSLTRRNRSQLLTLPLDPPLVPTDDPESDTLSTLNLNLKERTSITGPLGHRNEEKLLFPSFPQNNVILPTLTS